jgi:hypothetical protein
MSNCLIRIIAKFSCFLLALIATQAHATDTIEAWDEGYWNLDAYVGYDGIGRGQENRALGTELMVGYGVTSSVAVSLGLTIAAMEAMKAAEAGTWLCVFYNALDTEHFDLDLATNLYAQGQGLSTLGFNPFVELNLDSNNEMSGVGAYLRAGATLDGDADQGWQDTFGVGLGFTLGGYVTLAGDHMLLLEAETEVNPMAGGDETSARFSSVAVGYNLVLSGLAELITEVGMGLPTGGERLSGSVTIGAIFTIGGA